MSDLILPSSRPRPERMDPEDRLFRHRTRPDWGVGVWIREESTRRRLRFEDGEMRAFKKGYYDFLVPVDSEKVDVDEVFDRVVGEHEEAATLASTDEPPVVPFAAQVDVFLQLYPGGFHGDAFEAHWGTRSSSKHGLFEAAGKARALTAALEPEAAAALALELLSATVLVARRSTAPYVGLQGEDRLAFGRAVLTLLHGEARFGRRFSDWVTALRGLGIELGWRDATALLGLVHPNKHIAVRRRVLQLQARSTSPCKLPATPSLAGYRRARRVARSTRDRLLEVGLKPRNLLDVHAFVWETLRPKGIDLAKGGGADGQ